MKTITAVELRNNMGEIFRRVNAGEEILVSYRDKIQLKLSIDRPVVAKKRMTGLDALNAAPRKGHVFDPNKSYKELYYEHLEEKYGNHAQ